MALRVAVLPGDGIGAELTRAASTLPYTREEVERIAEAAFRLAEGRRTVDLASSGAPSTSCSAFAKAVTDALPGAAATPGREGP